jgi:pseudouridine kinase
MGKIAIIGEIRVKMTGSGYRQLNQNARTIADVWTDYTGTAISAAKQLKENGEDVMVVSAVGNDFIGKATKLDMNDKGMNTDFLKVVPGVATAAELETLNIIGDLDYLISGVEVNKFIDVELLESALAEINGCDLVVVDTSLTEEALNYIAENVTAPLFLDPGNDEDALKAKDIIGKFDIIKPNRAEASVLFGKDIFGEDELKAAADYFAEKGVKQIYITLSGGGVFYKNADSEGFIRPEKVEAFVRK